ncbi:MAG: TraR/DksA family transcriptional regulator [Planctomycetia bacterium]|nr:TraR/DksA family transcriptional regulator [Planctomycetia bacterium]
MSRKDALLRIHKSLVEKRDELRRQLANEIDLAHAADAGTGDLFDAAMDGTQNEMHSQLAAFESRELQQIERAIKLIRKGRYGSCEICDAAIPVARLKALPYTTVCIACRQKQETKGGGLGEDAENWETVFEYEGANSDRELTIRDIDIEID